MIRRALALTAACALAGAAGTARAHEFRPALLDVTDLGGGRYEVLWSAPSAGDPDAAEAAPTFPEACRREPGEGPRFVIDCGPAGLAGRTLAVRGLGAARADALVRYTGPAGMITAVLREDSPAFAVPASGEAPGGSRWARTRGYVGAGIEHILHGADHLLFVLGLLMLAWDRGAEGARQRPLLGLLRTVTAFTLAHSLTLALAVTAAVRLPPAPVEAAIALSLVLLAGELCRPAGAAPTLARRRPALLAFSFGLLHGFGFAGGLAALRVPAADLPLALGGFNLGVELGQLAFVAAALASLPLLRLALRPAHRARLLPVPAYAIGTLGMLFVCERVAAFWRS
jgi:hypothetical protein